MLEQASGMGGGIARSLEAVKVLACRGCGAPGVWKSPANAAEIEHFSRWIGVVVNADDPRRDKPVGERCPCCGASRRGLTQALGVIWRKFLPF